MEDDDVVNMKDPHVPDYIGDGEDGLKYGVEEITVPFTEKAHPVVLNPQQEI